MTQSAIWAAYEQRLLRVSDYIHAHLDDDLDLDRLAEVACLSPWHWHRVYRAVHGETLAGTVKRLRLQRAAADLAHSRLAVSRIAARAGYPDLSSFNRVFKSSYGLAPAAYRRAGSHAAYSTALKQGMTDMYDVKIKMQEEVRLAGIAHQGSYMAIGKAFDMLYGTLSARNQLQKDCGMVGLYHDDPDVVPVEALRSHACVTVGVDFKAEAPLEPLVLPGGYFAVLTHKGPYADMPEAYRWLYAGWLPQSGRELRNDPMFELYLNNPRDTAPGDLLTEIWMPLK
ncbi:AraC family transcriptional regulator [Nostoc sp. CHAB 5715]|nr:AraC family transcriptional regulator [Nostoc sp. CHAB 5836]MCC5621611.1 AraC family transcriptional regulator [Nostoc sp. CHAB 5715]